MHCEAKAALLGWSYWKKQSGQFDLIQGQEGHGDGLLLYLGLATSARRASKI